MCWRGRSSSWGHERTPAGGPSVRDVRHRHHHEEADSEEHPQAGRARAATIRALRHGLASGSRTSKVLLTAVPFASGASAQLLPGVSRCQRPAMPAVIRPPSLTTSLQKAVAAHEVGDAAVRARHQSAPSADRTPVTSAYSLHGTSLFGGRRSHCSAENRRGIWVNRAGFRSFVQGALVALSRCGRSSPQDRAGRHRVPVREVAVPVDGLLGPAGELCTSAGPRPARGCRADSARSALTRGVVPMSDIRAHSRSADPGRVARLLASGCAFST